VDDAGSALLSAITPGAGNAKQANSQCEIYSQGSGVQFAGKDVVLSVSVLFKPAFRGTKVMYGAVQTATGGNSGWQAITAVPVQ